MFAVGVLISYYESQRKMYDDIETVPHGIKVRYGMQVKDDSRARHRTVPYGTGGHKFVILRTIHCRVVEK